MQIRIHGLICIGPWVLERHLMLSDSWVKEMGRRESSQITVMYRQEYHKFLNHKTQEIVLLSIEIKTHSQVLRDSKVYRSRTKRQSRDQYREVLNSRIRLLITPARIVDHQSKTKKLMITITRWLLTRRTRKVYQIVMIVKHILGLNQSHLNN